MTSNGYFTQGWNADYGYECAAEYLLKGKDKTDRPFMNNTRVIREDAHTIVIRLHSTDIVTLKDNGDIVLDSGGWHTPLTKGRMNIFLPKPYQLMADKGMWFLGTSWDKEDRKAVFEDGLTIHADGTVTGGTSIEKFNYQTQLKKDIRKYAKAFANQVAKKKIPLPSAGDCWFCSMYTEDGKSLGETSSNNDHLLSHIKEKYYVPSLLYRAMDQHSVGALIHDDMIAMTMLCSNPEDDRVPNYYKEKGMMFEEETKRQIVKALIKYLERRLLV